MREDELDVGEVVDDVLVDQVNRRPGRLKEKLDQKRRCVQVGERAIGRDRRMNVHDAGSFAQDLPERAPGWMAEVSAVVVGQDVHAV